LDDYVGQSTLHENKFRVTPEMVTHFRQTITKNAFQLGIFEPIILTFDPHNTLYHGKKAEKFQIGKAYDTKRKQTVPAHRPTIVWDLINNTWVTYIYHDGSERGHRQLRGMRMNYALF
jgi:hypothetical protein